MNSLRVELSDLTELNPNQAQIYTAFQAQLITVIDEKIPSLFTSLVSIATPSDQAEVTEIRQQIATFEDIQKKRLYQLVQVIAGKSSFVQPTSTFKPDNSAKTSAVHLKKVDPPSFSGNEVDFPEFERKWLAIVVPANLPPEAEIDRLRDALPQDAREMLTGINTTVKAWDVLKKRFGDKDLISTKLKNELKGLSLSAKTDHEKIINLVIKIRSLVSRLETLGTSEALKYDGEFVSAIYFQLPDRQKTEWLKFEKSSFPDKWAAITAFLEEIYERAVQEKLLIASYMSTTPKQTGSGTFGATVIGEPPDRDPLVDDKASKEDKQKQRLQEARAKVGHCPICGEVHTFKSKWSATLWPSDRLVQCQKFGDLNSNQRAEALERLHGCSRCTSWGHDKSECKVNVIDCKEIINGTQCHRDHLYAIVV